MRMILPLLLLGLVLTPELAIADLITFDDLVNDPTTSIQLLQANNGNSTYRGVNWGADVQLVGDAYRIQSDAPPFGAPHSGDYFISNAGTSESLVITTNQVLVSSYWGQNAYYGFDHSNGADQITITPLLSSGTATGLTFDFVPSINGQPGLLTEFDTSSFLSLSGIIGYEIKRHAPSEFAVNWVADDFKFVDPVSAVPEPSSLALAAIGFIGHALRRRQRQQTTA